jgi:hypothetical protein
VDTETTLREAVAIHLSAYRLLRWMAEAVERGFVGFDRAHEYATMDAAAAEWIAKHHENLPTDGRPAARRGPELERFARYFSTFLKTSFELVEEPGKTLKSPCGCFCEMCSYLANASHLKMRKVTRAHRRRAEELKRHHLGRLFSDAGLEGVDVEALLRNDELSRRAALSAYGAELLRRCRGHSYGAPVLALWRQFAWTSTGAPDRKFQLTYEGIAEAREALLAAARSRRGSAAE